MAQEWKDLAQLSSVIYPSLLEVFKSHPRPGWVREDQSTLANLAFQVQTLTEKCQELSGELESVRGKIKLVEIDRIAGLEYVYRFVGTYGRKGYSNKYPWVKELAFGQAFGIVGPSLMQTLWADSVNRALALELANQLRLQFDSVEIAPACFETFQTQLQALHLISVDVASSTGGGGRLTWSLTALGRATVLKLRTLTSDSMTS